MAATPNCQIVESAVLAEFPHARFGRYNCRHIGSNPLRSWSQHAGSEPDFGYFGNALDITHKDFGYNVTPVHTAWLKQVYGFLRPLFIVDQLLGPGDAGHGDHVHVSTWPKMKSTFSYKPPCKGGKLVVIYEDGTKGDTFGALAPPPPPPEEEEMVERSDKADEGMAIHAANFQEAIDAGVMSNHTQPGGVAFNDEIATFLARIGIFDDPPLSHPSRQIEALEARIATLEAVGLEDGDTVQLKKQP